ncbi:MAG: hypothetical protein CMH41_03420 [Micrococcales bacterium]|nr:hypothetical protein [Micrococcales bacterium]
MGSAVHTGCATALDLEPPRFCPRCRRRMVVQVTPAGWEAHCSQHGPPPRLTSSREYPAEGK